MRLSSRIVVVFAVVCPVLLTLGAYQAWAQDDDRSVLRPPWARDRDRDEDDRWDRRDRRDEVLEPVPVRVVEVADRATRWEYAKLVHAKRNAPTHQLLYHGPGGDYAVAGDPNTLARQLFGGRRFNVRHPDDLVNLLAAQGWEPFAHNVVIFRGDGVGVEREYWSLRRPVVREDRRRP